MAPWKSIGDLLGQFWGTLSTAQTTGVQRLYDSLDVGVYYASEDNRDFSPPSIWRVEALDTGAGINFRVLAEDESGEIQRVLVLYRQEMQREWQLLDLPYNPANGWAEGQTGLLTGRYEYFVQVVDMAGNGPGARPWQPVGAFVEPTFGPTGCICPPYIGTDTRVETESRAFQPLRRPY
jgi:hypothetical protein